MFFFFFWGGGGGGGCVSFFVFSFFFLFLQNEKKDHIKRILNIFTLSQKTQNTLDTGCWAESIGKIDIHPDSVIATV